MARFHQKSTQTRMAFLIGVLILAAAVNALIGITNASSVQQKMAELQMVQTQLDYHADARTSLLKQQIAIKNMMITEEERVFDYGNLDRYLQLLDEYIYHQQTRQFIQAGNAAGMRLDFDALTQSIDQYYEVLFEQEDEALAALIILDEIDPLMINLDAQIQQLALEDMAAFEALSFSVSTSSKISLVAGVVALLLMAAMVVWAVYLMDGITRPLERMTGAVIAFENGVYSPDMLEDLGKQTDELGQLASAINRMALTINESNRQQALYLRSAQRFIPSQYLEFLQKDSITNVNLGDHVRAEMAVMFSDIRGFTTLSEKMTARENFDFVNEYLKLVSPIVQKHEGFIVKFLGDGMMAIFPYGVADAVQAGVEKAKMVAAFNQQLAQRGYPPISVGIGIHTGTMMVGMIGEEMRMQGDAFSDNVNLTSRIEGLNKFYGTSMIISEETLAQLPQNQAFKMRYLGKAQVKGRAAPLGMYEVYDGLLDEEIAAKDATRQAFELGVSLYMQAEFFAAAEKFSQVLQQYPKDATAQLYLSICKDQAGKPKPADWAGAIVMDAK